MIWMYWSDHKDDEGTGASLVGGKAQRAGTLQTRDQEAWMGSCQCIQVAEGRMQKG